MSVALQQSHVDQLSKDKYDSEFEMSFLLPNESSDEVPTAEACDWSCLATCFVTLWR
jgi:hypothetical protein